MVKLRQIKNIKNNLIDFYKNINDWYFIKMNIVALSMSTTQFSQIQYQLAQIWLTFSSVLILYTTYQLTEVCINVWMLAVQIVQITADFEHTVIWVAACMLMPFQAAFASDQPLLDLTVMHSACVLSNDFRGLSAAASFEHNLQMTWLCWVLLCPCSFWIPNVSKP